MVLQVGPDTLQGMDYGNAVLAQFLRIPDPGKLQDLWRLNRPGADQNLPVRMYDRPRLGGLVRFGRLSTG